MKNGFAKVITLEIEKLAQGGDGLARNEGQVVFIPYTLPGERVEVTITREKKDYAEGYISSILTASPERRAPLCPVFTRCGGCQLQHVSEKTQVQYKIAALKEILSRIGKVEGVDVLPTIASPLPFNYRTRAQLKILGGTIGFYRRKSHQIVPIDACPLLIPSLNRLVSLIREENRFPKLEEVELQGIDSGDQMLIVLRAPRFHRGEMTSFYERLKARLPLEGLIAYSKEGRYQVGADYLRQIILGREIRMSDRSFSQVNGAILPQLIETVREWVAPASEDRILELYSGLGTFTLFLAEGIEAMTAIEENPNAVEDARWNIDRAGLKNVRLLMGSADAALRRIDPEKEKYTKVFIDPPREGATREVLERLVRYGPEKIFYLSCDPATFARDLHILAGQEYRLARLQPFDLFPQTGHLEVLGEIIKGNPILKNSRSGGATL